MSGGRFQTFGHSIFTGRSKRSKFEENRPKIRSFLGPLLGPPARLFLSQKLGGFCDKHDFARAAQIVVDQGLSARDLAGVLSPIWQSTCRPFQREIKQARIKELRGVSDQREPVHAGCADL